MKHNYFKILLVIFIIPLLFFSCGKNEKKKSEKRTSDSVILWLSNDFGVNEKDFRFNLSKFFEFNSEISLEVEMIDKDKYLSKLIDASQGIISPPDLALIDMNDFSNFENTKPFESLDDFYKESEYIGSTISNVKYSNDPIKFGIPFAVNVKMFFYQKDIFNKNKVNTENIFKDFSSFEKALLKLESKTKKPPLSFSTLDKNTIKSLYPFILSNQGDFFDRSNKYSLIDSRRTQDSVKLFSELITKKLIDKESLYKSDSELKKDFLSGNSIIYYGDSSFIYELEKSDDKIKNNIGIGYTPKGKKGKFNYIFGKSFVMFKESQKKEEVKKLLTFLYQDDFHVIYSRKFKSLPVKNTVFQDQLYSSPFFNNIQKELVYGKQFPVIKDWNKIETIIDNGLNEVIENVVAKNRTYKFKKTKSILIKTKQDIDLIIN